MMSVPANSVDTVDFAAAAQALVDGCVDLSRDEDRVALLDTVCRGLGDALYPAFVQLLWLVGRYGDHGARATLARTLVHALRTGRLPSGRRAAWGGVLGMLGASGLASGLGGSGVPRSFGPIEYLCAWYAHADAERPLNAEEFHRGACAVMELVGASDEARALYCEKLLGDVDDPIGGAFARSTREAIRALAQSWAQGAAATDASARFLIELDKSRGTAGAPRVPQMPQIPMKTLNQNTPHENLTPQPNARESRMMMFPSVESHQSPQVGSTNVMETGSNLTRDDPNWGDAQDRDLKGPFRESNLERIVRSPLERNRS